MRLGKPNKPETDGVYVGVVEAPRRNRSKSVRLYGWTIDEVVEVLTKAVKAKERRKAS